MRRRSDKYASEALRNVGTAFVVGSFFREDNVVEAFGLFATGLILLVAGWFFAPKEPPPSD